MPLHPQSANITNISMIYDSSGLLWPNTYHNSRPYKKQNKMH